MIIVVIIIIIIIIIVIVIGYRCEQIEIHRKIDIYEQTALLSFYLENFSHQC